MVWERNKQKSISERTFVNVGQLIDTVVFRTIQKPSSSFDTAIIFSKLAQLIVHITVHILIEEREREREWYDRLRKILVVVEAANYIEWRRKTN